MQPGICRWANPWFSAHTEVLQGGLPAPAESFRQSSPSKRKIEFCPFLPWVSRGKNTFRRSLCKPLAPTKPGRARRDQREYIKRATSAEVALLMKKRAAGQRPAAPNPHCRVSPNITCTKSRWVASPPVPRFQRPKTVDAASGRPAIPGGS